IGGQPFQLFQGAHPESQLRPLFDEMLQMAAQQGVTGTLSAQGDEPQGETPAEPELPPLHQEGVDALERGDLQAAHDAYSKQLAQAPADKEAMLALRQVELMQRCAEIDDLQAAVDNAGEPTDVAAQLRAADVEFAQGQVGAAFDRLLACVRATHGDAREQARARLVELFDLVGDDPRTNDYRRQLATALY
ncbi:MAG: tetratricopeptide repeat protein, partial [Bowdeniella nasicola]|nr:tetratricopeptide repeat protein [Bowdeniella nasicola]